MKKNKREDYLEAYKVRGLRLSDKNWEKFANNKPRDQSWELFIKEINELIDKFKSFGNN